MAVLAASAVLAESGSNPDVELLYDINGLAKAAPHWFDRVMEFVGEYGLPVAMVLLILGCWLSVRRRGGREAAPAVAALVWAPLAAALAVVVNAPIRNFVERPRPFVDHQGLDVLIAGKSDFSFCSDHATITMAMAVGLFVANRRFGMAGIAIALLEGFCRVYMGVHYPTDVIGGFALGTAVALLLSPPATALLTPLIKAIERSPRAGRLVRARTAPTDHDNPVLSGDRRATGAGAGEKDLAA
ncbi:phosphatase PAP2 family protein [Streptomyces sp. LaPpAH-108]|uniref:phosphatase PAP2 family protein n=1 Tax=Streptomyces sp. LaPpAH-108 TaxID=1155714 RepID=UPI000374C01C|nr:phosphatase PAP2 family protein [Streptomyces sp. LaPpAH-108]